MTVNRKWVRQVEDVLAEITPRREQPDTAEILASRAFQLHEFNTATPVVEQSPRARAIREVTRIAAWYGWGDEVVRALDGECVVTLSALSPVGLEQLVARMRQLEECVQNGGDAPDVPPAR